VTTFQKVCVNLAVIILGVLAGMIVGILVLEHFHLPVPTL
jgi:hypothetical protein